MAVYKCLNTTCLSQLIVPTSNPLSWRLFAVISKIISLGPAPDYLIKAGKVSIYHSASIQFTRDFTKTSKKTISNQSFFNLIADLADHCIGFGVSQSTILDQSEPGMIQFNCYPDSGEIKIKYMAPAGLTPGALSMLNTCFSDRICALLLIHK